MAAGEWPLTYERGVGEEVMTQKWLRGVAFFLTLLAVAIPASLAKQIPYTLEDRERLIRTV
jgi:hypothetical protein